MSLLHLSRWIPQFCCHLAMAVLLTFTGCESLDEAGIPTPGASARAQKKVLEEESYRERYQTSRDYRSLKWLLANRVKSGMTLAEINAILGESGERIYDDLPFKTKGGNYRSSDVAYKWGPTSSGNAVVLMFRDRKLVNFDPYEFEDEYGDEEVTQEAEPKE